MRSENINELVTALAKAQGAIEAPKFNREVGYTGRKFKYADGAALREAIRKPLADNGLAITFTNLLSEDGSYVMTGTLWHTSGQWISSEYPLPAVAKPQDRAAEITYGRRYLTCEFLNVYGDEDHDAPGGPKAELIEPKAKPSPIQPAPVEPPMHPETGEVSPHPIPYNNEQPIEWARSYIAAVKTAMTVTDINEWEFHNKASLIAIKQVVPKTHKMIADGTQKLRDSLASL